MGLEAERFVEAIDDDLKCGICYSVLEDPLVTSCGHVYCSQCLVPWIAESGSCPLTCEQLAIDDLKKIVPLTTLIAKLGIRCENFRRGCPIILKVEHIHSHHLKCQYAKEIIAGDKIMERAGSAAESEEFSQVVVCEKGCALPLLQQDSSSHNCIKALQTQVASLQMKLTKTEHEKEVTSEKSDKREEALQDRLLSVENELHSYQIQVLNLERQLKEYRTRVGYLQRQLGHRAAEEIEVDVQLERADGTLGFNIMGGGTSEVGSGDEGEGIVVSKVADGGPASKTGGLRVFDRVLKVNGIDLRKASHKKAVETIKTATEPVQLVVLRRKIERNIEYCTVNEVISTSTQTEICHDVDTDSGIHDRYSPRQDLQLDGCKSLDEGTSSSESSHQRIDTVRERLLSLTSESLASLQNTSSTETSETSVPRVSLMVKDVNYVSSDRTEDRLRESFQGQPFVSAVSDEIYFDPELDYEYEEITLWIGNSDLGLTFSCLEEDESAVYVCDIDPGSVAYLDGRLTLLDQVLKINDVPVSHISDIEPMVCDSSATIKFLVARPAQQQVKATLVGSSEGSGHWNEYNGFGIDVIKEEDEDGGETVSSEKTNMEKCEKDSGVGRNDESSDQDVAEESVTNAGEVDKCNRVSQQKEEPKHKKHTALERNTEKLSSQGNGVKAYENDRNADHSKRRRRSPHGDSLSRTGDSPKRTGDSSRRGGDSSSRKSKSKSKSERKKGRESSRDTPVDEAKSDREHSRHSVQMRSRRTGHMDRTVRASYIRACNKDSIRDINLIGSNGFGDELEFDKSKSEYQKNFRQSMEWKVRITKDGSQIFVQKKDPVSGRQARNKLLRERAQKITDERKGLTTDDDTHTVYQGRYWPRESRRTQLEKVRESRRRKTLKSQQVQKASDSGSESGRRDIVEMSHRKLNRRRERFDDFATLQEILRQRNPGGLPSGPIHVTTV